MIDPELSDSGPRSVQRVLRVLEHLADEVEGLTLTALSEKIGAPKSSSLSILKALCEYKYVQHSGRNYILGPSAYRLSDRINFDQRALEIVEHHLNRLVAVVGETAIFAVHEKQSHEALYIAKCESRHPVRYTVPVGTKRPLYCTSAGRIILAYSASGYLNTYLSQLDPKTFTDKTVTDVLQLRAIIKKIKEQGYVINFEELLDGIYGVSVPVNLVNQHFYGAIAVAVPYNRATDVQESILKAMQGVASDLGEQLSAGIRSS